MFDVRKLQNKIEKFTLNISEEDVFDFIRNEKRWPLNYNSGQKSIEYIDNFGRPIALGLYTSENYINFDSFIKLYNKGFTFVISSVFDLNKELRDLHDKIIDVTGVKINGNFYFSKGGQQPSFDSHKHPYSVIVKQIYGKGYWKVDKIYKELQPGKTLCVPAETYHQFYKVDTKKLSLTFNLQ